MRCYLALLVLACCWLPVELPAAQPSVRSQLNLATIRLSNPKSSATAFILVRPDATDHPDQPLALVTSAHVFEQAQGDEMVITLRRKDSDFEYSKLPAPLKIRENGKPLWKKHPKADVAVLPLAAPAAVELPKLSADTLATNDELGTVEPGDFVRSFGFPHTPLFDPTSAAFPTVRLGCIASYPVRPTEKQPTYLIDSNTFEGDSGGPVVWESAEKTTKIVGLIQGQHFINLRYDFPYESGEIRKQLGVAIIVPSSTIREAIDKLPEK